MLLIFILLSIWLCRLPEKPAWLAVRPNISTLELFNEQPARSKGLRRDMSRYKKSPRNSGAFYYQKQEKKHVNSKSNVARWR